MSVEVGDKAPDFSLPADGGGTVSLKALKGKTGRALFLSQGRHVGLHGGGLRLSRRASRLLQVKAEIVGVSRDSVASHDKFKRKFDLPFPLASDEDGKVCQAYGVWVEKSMYGKKYMGIERATFLIDAKGVVRDIWRKVKVDGPRRRGAERRARSEIGGARPGIPGRAAPSRSKAANGRPSLKRSYCAGGWSGCAGCSAGGAGSGALSPPPHVLADKPTSAIAAAAATIRNFLMSSSPFLVCFRPSRLAGPSLHQFQAFCCACGAPHRISFVSGDLLINQSLRRERCAGARAALLVNWRTRQDSNL